VFQFEKYNNNNNNNNNNVSFIGLPLKEARMGAT